MLCILSGVSSKPESYAKASIGFHIVSSVASTIGAAVSSVFWQMYKDPNACVNNNTTAGECMCFSETYAISCADGEVSRILLAILTAANIFMIMTSFLGSLLACTNVCCNPAQSNEQRSSRNNTSHSEQTVVSNGANSGHELSIVRLNSIQANVEHRNYITPSSSETKQSASNSEENYV